MPDFFGGTKIKARFARQDWAGAAGTAEKTAAVGRVRTAAPLPFLPQNVPGKRASHRRGRPRVPHQGGVLGGLSQYPGKGDPLPGIRFYGGAQWNSKDLRALGFTQPPGFSRI